MDFLDFFYQYGTIIGCSSIVIAMSIYIIGGAWHRERRREENFERHLRCKDMENEASCTCEGFDEKEAGNEQYRNDGCD